MKRILISNESGFEDSINIEHFFEAGLELFHIRKPEFSEAQTEMFLKKIPSRLRPFCVLHYHHQLAIDYNLGGIHFPEKHRESLLNKKNQTNVLKKFELQGYSISASLHSIADLHGNHWLFDYVFFSPVFPSISKKEHKPEYEWPAITSAIRESNLMIIALGGIYIDNIEDIVEAGFHGYALKGAVWNANNPVIAFKEIVKKEESATSNVASSSDTGRCTR